MKKWYKIIACTAAICICAGILILTGVNVSAENNSIRSNGNFEFNYGEAAIYFEDINYLQDEINSLFNEIN